MRLRTREERAWSKLEKRVKALSNQQLTAWADTYLITCGQSLLSYNREGLPAFLEEAEDGAVALLAVIRELACRSR